jgi:D-xylose transport system ATP-binding protein
MTHLLEMRNIVKRFGGVAAVDDVSIHLEKGEVLGLLGHNGAGKSTLIKILSGAYPADAGTITVDGAPATIHSPRDARKYGIETIYQTLALADNLDSVANIFLGREKLTPSGALDEAAMEHAARGVLTRLNPHFVKHRVPVAGLSGGQRQVVAISRAVYFQARILIMDEPCAALGPAETAMVGNLIRQLKNEGIGIIVISHDLHDVFALCDRLTVMKTGKVVGTVMTQDVTQDDVLAMIIAGRMPAQALAA